MALLEDGAWHGKLWTGTWADGSGGTYLVVRDKDDLRTGTADFRARGRILGEVTYAFRIGDQPFATCTVEII